MFLKPFKVKSNNQLKGTERKKLCEEVLQAFPSLKDDDVQNLLRKKDIISVMKIVTHTGQVGRVYCTAKIPVLFQFDIPVQRLYPTVYTLWQYPELLTSFTMHSSIIPNLLRGADLMLPGVILKGPPSLKSFGKLIKGTVVSVNTSDNKAPIAVGFTALSIEDMYMSGGYGKCVEIVHIIGDTLCQLENSLTRPKLDPPMKDELDSPVANESIEKESVDIVESVSESIENLEVSENVNSEYRTDEEEEEVDINDAEPKTPETNPAQDMDKLLEYCFLKACKMSIKVIDLPMLTSNFFKNHVLAACPPGQSLDVKTSTYKKLSVFLSSMKDKGIIHTSIIKGVESILSIKTDHPLIKALVIMENDAANPVDVGNAPFITECYRVTTNVLPILSKSGYEKGDVMRRPDIRKCFTDYVKKENLQNGKMFKLDPQLAGILQTPESVLTMKMEDGINKFTGKMTLMREISIGDSKILHCGKIEPIDITVVSRRYNKKVTLINNLEIFGIKLDEFSKECQGIGASATVTDVPGKKSSSVLVQGNQVLYVYKLLTEKYRINKTYIRGLEFAPKKRK